MGASAVRGKDDGRLVVTRCGPGGAVDTLSRGVAALALLLLSVTAGAGWPDCVNDSTVPGTWKVQIPTFTKNACPNATSMAAAVECQKQAILASYTNHTATVDRRTCFAYSGGECTTYGHRFRIYNASGTLVSTRSEQSYWVQRTLATPAVCPTFDCATVANIPASYTVSNKPDTYTPPEILCVKGTQPQSGGGSVDMGSTGCQAFQRAEQPHHRLGPSGAREWRTNYKFTGMACDPTDTAPDPMPSVQPSAETCVVKNGLELCASAEGTPNCGYVNNDYLCVRTLQPDKCYSMTDGGRLCASGAKTPPVPDSGTAGVKATPTETLSETTTAGTTNNVQNTYNYYNAAAVAASERAPGTGSGPGGTGTIGEGGIEETEEEGPTGEVSGGATCVAPPECNHDDPVQCALLEQQWQTRCVDDPVESEILDAIGATESERAEEMPLAGTVELGTLDASGSITSASCPAPLSVTIMGQALSLDVWAQACAAALMFAPITMLIAYLGAGLLLVRGYQ